MPVCRECDAPISSHKPHIKCSLCDFDIHLECIGLSKEEATCITRSKAKNIKMYCSRCHDNESKLEQLIKKLEARDSKIDELSAKLDNFYTRFNDRLSAVENSIVSLQIKPRAEANEETIQESVERLKRAGNIILTKLPEVSPAEDADAVNKIVKTVIGYIPENISITRLGRNGSSGTSATTSRIRPVKVRLGDPDVVKHILRNKNKLINSPYKAIKIFDDQTPMQREFLESKRTELKTRTDLGENNITIKYLKGIPTIVPTSAPKK